MKNWKTWVKLAAQIVLVIVTNWPKGGR